MRKRILQLKAINGQVTIDGINFKHPTDTKNIQYVFILFYVPDDDNKIDYVLGTDATEEYGSNWKRWEPVS